MTQYSGPAKVRPHSASARSALLTIAAVVALFSTWSSIEGSNQAFVPQPIVHPTNSFAQASLQAGRVASSTLATSWSPARKQSFIDQRPALRSAEGSLPDVPTSANDGERMSLIETAQRSVGWAVGSVVGLIALLYVTRAFELILDSSTSLLTGKSLLVATLTGLLVGALHTLAGPDHFAGLAPLVIGQRRTPLAAFGLGALWGSGHATGQLLLGMAALAVHFGFLQQFLPALDQMNQLSGCLVGASLIAIGFLGYYESRQFDENDLLAAEEDGTPEKQRFGWTTYATGVLHGLSPDALVFLAPAFALPAAAAALHVAGVVVGTFLSMGACTAMLSALCRKLPNFSRVSGAASSVSMLLGLSILAATFGFSVPLPGL